MVDMARSSIGLAMTALARRCRCSCTDILKGTVGIDNKDRRVEIMVSLNLSAKSCMLTTSDMIFELLCW